MDVRAQQPRLGRSSTTDSRGITWQAAPVFATLSRWRQRLSRTRNRGPESARLTAGIDASTNADVRLRRFIHANLATALFATIVALSLFAWSYRSGWLLVISAATGSVCAVNVLALAHLRRSATRAVLLVAASTLSVSVVITWIAPVTLDITIVLCVLPVVLAIPFLNNRQLIVLSVLTVTVAGSIVGLGRWQSGARLEQVVPKWIPDGLVLVFVPISTMLICLAAWYNQTELHALAGELRRARGRLVAATDDARRRLERDLRVGTQRSLTLAEQHVTVGLDLFMSDTPRCREEFQASISVLTNALAELRILAHGVYPPTLTMVGLDEALLTVAPEAGDRLSIDCRGVGRYPRSIEAGVYFCCVEAIQNALRHGGNSVRVSVLLNGANGLHFEIADDGPGFDVASSRESRGLVNMRDRMGALGGSLSITSVPGASGTVVAGSIGQNPSQPSEPPPWPHSTSSGESIGQLYTERLFVMNLLVTLQSVAFIAWAYFQFGRKPIVLLIEALTLAAGAGLYYALRLLRSGRPSAGAIWSVCMFQGFTLGLAFILPAIQPYAPLVLLVPVVIAVPCVGASVFRSMTACTIAVSILTVVATRLLHWSTLLRSLPKWFIDLLLLQYVTATVAVICFAAWQNHAGLHALEEELRRSWARVVNTTDEARRRLERDLHDAAPRQISTASLKLRTGLMLMDVDLQRARQAFDTAIEMLRTAASEFHDLCYGVYPSTLTEHGLGAALDSVARDIGDRVQIDRRQLGRYPQSVEAGVYFSCLEAIQNALKHGGDGVRVRVVLDGTRGLHFEVIDDGPGFDFNAGTSDEGTGLINMRDRMHALGGSLHVATDPKRNFTVITGAVPESAWVAPQ